MKSKSTAYSFIFFTILLVLLSLATWRVGVVQNKLTKEREYNNLLTASKDSLKLVFNDKTKQWQSEREIFKANDETLTKYLKNNEKELYDIKKDYNSIVGILSKISFEADTVVLNDTVRVIDKDSTVRVANIVNPFYSAHIKSYADSTKLSIRGIYNEQKFSIDSKGKLIITNSNPYIVQEDGKGFYITQPKEKTKNWKYYIGIAGGLIGGYYIFK